MANVFVSYPAQTSTDSSGNVVSPAGVEVAATSDIGWQTRTQLTAPVDGRVMVAYSNGTTNTNAGLAFGSTTASGALLVLNASGNLEAVKGDSSADTGIQVKTLVTANAGGIAVGNSGSATTGLSFPTTTSIALSTNGTVGFSLDASQNATFSGPTTTFSNAAAFINMSTLAGGTCFTSLGQANFGEVQVQRATGDALRLTSTVNARFSSDSQVGWAVGNGSNTARDTTMYRAAPGIVGFSAGATAAPGGAISVYQNIQSKTAPYTAVLADTGTHFDNTGATGSVTITLPAPTKGWNACFTVIAAQTLVLTTPSGAIIAPGFTAGATRTITAQYTTVYLVCHDSTNYIVEMLTGTIAS